MNYFLFCLIGLLQPNTNYLFQPNTNYLSNVKQHSDTVYVYYFKIQEVTNRGDAKNTNDALIRNVFGKVADFREEDLMFGIESTLQFNQEQYQAKVQQYGFTLSYFEMIVIEE